MFIANIVALWSFFITNIAPLQSTCTFVKTPLLTFLALAQAFISQTALPISFKIYLSFKHLFFIVRAFSQTALPSSFIYCSLPFAQTSVLHSTSITFSQLHCCLVYVSNKNRSFNAQSNFLTTPIAPLLFYLISLAVTSVHPASSASPQFIFYATLSLWSFFLLHTTLLLRSLSFDS